MGNWIGELPAKLIEWAIVGSLGYLIASVLEWRKRIYFASSDWKFEYFHMSADGGWHYDENPPDAQGKIRAAGHQPRYMFTIRLFNKKSYAVGLHRISVQYMEGPWYRRQIVLEDSKLSHGRGSVHAGSIHHDALSEMTLPSHEWASEDIIGYVDNIDLALKADSVWLSAYSPEGKHFKWQVTQLHTSPTT